MACCQAARAPSTSPCSASSTPRLNIAAENPHPWEILDRDAPLAWATAAIPPWPSERASPASTNRCCRSSRCGNTTASFARNDSTTSARTATTTSWPTESQIEWLFLGEPLAVYHLPSHGHVVICSTPGSRPHAQNRAHRPDPDLR